MTGSYHHTGCIFEFKIDPASGTFHPSYLVGFVYAAYTRSISHLHIPLTGFRIVAVIIMYLHALKSSSHEPNWWRLPNLWYKAIDNLILIQ